MPRASYSNADDVSRLHYAWRQLVASHVSQATSFHSWCISFLIFASSDDLRLPAAPIRDEAIHLTELPNTPALTSEPPS